MQHLVMMYKKWGENEFWGDHGVQEIREAVWDISQGCHCAFGIEVQVRGGNTLFLASTLK